MPFVPTTTLQRCLREARRAGVGEVWLFGTNGFTGDIVRTPCTRRCPSGHEGCGRRR